MSRRIGRITYDLTASLASTLAKPSPTMTPIYVSDARTDSTEPGRMMRAPVKGKTEHALLQMPFKAVYMFRPAYIQPLQEFGQRRSVRSLRKVFRTTATYA